MAVKYPAFRSFTAGEISPRMFARSDLPMYHHAVSQAENFSISPQGSAVLRKGWKHITVASEEDVGVRLLTFNRAFAEDYVIALSANSILAFNMEGQIPVDINVPALANGNPLVPALAEEYIQLLRNGNFEQGYAYWNAQYFNTASGIDERPPEVISGWHTSNHYARATLQFQTDYLTQKFSKPTEAGLDDIIRLSFRTKFDAAVYPARSDGTPVNYVGWSVFLYDQDDEELANPLGFWEGTDLGLNEINIPWPVGYNDLMIVFSTAFTPWVNIPLASGCQFTDISALFEITPVTPPLPSDLPWAEERIPLIQTVMLTGQNAMFMCERSAPPYVLSYNSTTNRFSLDEAPLVGTPAWSVATGWPGVCEVFQGRLWLMSTVAEPSGIWGSKSGILLDFTVGVEAADGLYLPLATKGVIQWAVGLQLTMSVGTDRGEYVLSSNGPIITPSDAAAQPVSSYGSAPIQAQTIGDQVMFVTPDARKLLATNYDDNLKNWVATELTWVAQHLSADQIRRFVNLRNPDYQIVCLTANGFWVQCVYDRVMGILGWQRNTMSGRIGSITGARTLQGDVLWGAIKFNGKVHISRLEPAASTEVHLDEWVRRFPLEDANGWYVDDLLHLQFQQVSALVDGAVTKVGAVAEDGTLRLPYGGDDAYVGVPYVARLVTLPEEPADSTESYSGGKKRNNDITVRLVDSAMPLINGKRPADRTPTTLMNTREANVTSDINVRSLGWDGQGPIIIEQDKPLRTEIVGIFTKLNVNKT